MEHDYTYPNLRALLAKALLEYSALSDTLFALQEATGIPGLHTNINSEDDSAGVLERIQAMYDEGESSLEAFKEFDDAN